MACGLRVVEENVLWKGPEFLANLERNAKIRHVILGIHPCAIITKLNQDANMAEIANSDRVMLKRHPAQSRRKRVLKDQLLYWRKKSKLVVCVRIPIRRSLIHGKLENIGIERISGTQREILRRHLAQNLKFGKEKSHLEETSQSVSLIKRNPCAPRFEDRSQEETSRQESRARKAAWDLAKNIFKLKTKRQDYLLFSCGSKGARIYLNITRGENVCCWFRSFHAYSEQKRFDSSRNGHVKTVTVVTANGEVQTTKKTQVYVHDQGLFVTVQVLE